MYSIQGIVATKIQFIIERTVVESFLCLCVWFDCDAHCCILRRCASNAINPCTDQLRTCTLVYACFNVRSIINWIAVQARLRMRCNVWTEMKHQKVINYQFTIVFQAFRCLVVLLPLYNIVLRVGKRCFYLLII